MDEGEAKTDSTEEMESRRTVTVTEKAIEDKLHRLLGTRRGKLAGITTLMREVCSLITEAGNLPAVQEIMQDEFKSIVLDFKEINGQVGGLLPADEREADIKNWFEPKMIVISGFTEETEKWMEQEISSLRPTDQEDKVEVVVVVVLLKKPSSGV